MGGLWQTRAVDSKWLRAQVILMREVLMLSKSIRKQKKKNDRIVAGVQSTMPLAAPGRQLREVDRMSVDRPDLARGPQGGEALRAWHHPRRHSAI